MSVPFATKVGLVGAAALTAFTVSWPAQALTTDQLKSLQETVREMCLLPDRAGNYLSVQGEAKAGLPVAVKIVKGEIVGKISYETWKGIPITLDKYKTDPRQCSLEMMRLLLPSFQTPAISTTGDGSPVITGTGSAANIDIKVDKSNTAPR